ncbi:MAG: hypothetical protein JWN44_5143 [Myxococcales bacterium]|nr:hypothetical protein [Myxococcales bacterium]
MTRISRRTFLKGAAGAAVALPLLDIMSRRGGAATPAFPKRFLVWFQPDGSIHENWAPTGSGTNFTLSRILAPLAAYQSSLVVVDGVKNKVGDYGEIPGDDHQKGMGTMLTGVHLLPGSQAGGCDTCPAAGLASGMSVDQAIANQISANNKFKSLELGIQAGSSGAWAYSNYSAANTPLPPDNNPHSVFARVFTDLGVDSAALARLRAERKSVLDAVSESYQSLSAKLGPDDKQKIDSHFTTIRDLEARLTVPGATVGDSCSKPGDPGKLDFMANDNFPTVAKLQMDLMVMALACDLTRVGTLQFENSVGDVRFSWLGLTRGHHDMSHDGDTVANTIEDLTKINIWYSQQLAYLLGKLKAIPEGNGTMLDNTLVFCVNELSRGNAHSHNDMPYVLAGGAGGALQMGRYLKFTGDLPHNNLLVSLMNVMGVGAKTFGDPAFCTGPLAL